MSDNLPPRIHKENGPITVQLATRVKGSITVDNFLQRLDRLKQLNEDEYRRTTDITSFQSKVIPISHPEATSDSKDLDNVLVAVGLLRQVSQHFYSH